MAKGKILANGGARDADVGAAPSVTRSPYNETHSESFVNARTDGCQWQNRGSERKVASLTFESPLERLVNADEQLVKARAKSCMQPRNSLFSRSELPAIVRTQAAADGEVGKRTRRYGMRATVSLK